MTKQTLCKHQLFSAHLIRSVDLQSVRILEMDFVYMGPFLVNQMTYLKRNAQIFGARESCETVSENSPTTLEIRGLFAFKTSPEI